MDDYHRLADTFDVIGIEFNAAAVNRFKVDWYGYPKEWLGYLSINAVTVQFVFDMNGRYLGAGTGDDQPALNLRGSGME